MLGSVLCKKLISLSSKQHQKQQLLRRLLLPGKNNNNGRIVRRFCCGSRGSRVPPRFVFDRSFEQPQHRQQKEQRCFASKSNKATGAPPPIGSIGGGSLSFRAWRVDEQQPQQQTRDALAAGFHGSEQTVTITDNDNDNDNDDCNTVLVRVTHSSLNYKDALSASGNKGVTRSFPHTPGIDASGTIISSTGAHNKKDNENDDNDNGIDASVLVTGYDLGMNTDGGFGEVIRVPSKWVLAPNPFASVVAENDDDSDSDTTKAAAAAKNHHHHGYLSMVYGTAGLTAALCVTKLLENGSATPSDGRVLVTGATGGVGSISVEILSQLGFEVVALSGKARATNDNDDTNDKNNKDKDRHRDRLMELGATEVVGRDALAATSRPLLKPEYAHAIDTVGGRPLSEILKKLRPGGSVAACGNSGGLFLGGSEGSPTTVLPFILRGVQLLGVDSVEVSLATKERAWKKLAGEWRCPVTEKHALAIGRHELDRNLAAMLRGESSGRVVLDHSLTKQERIIEQTNKRTNKN